MKQEKNKLPFILTRFTTRQQNLSFAMYFFVDKDLTEGYECFWLKENGSLIVSTQTNANFFEEFSVEERIIYERS